MDRFVARHRPVVTGVLTGFDRLVFRGTLIPLVREGGMYAFLKRAGVQLLDFKRFVLETTERLKEAAVKEARRLERPVRYLERPTISKEDLAKTILAERPTERGLVCTLTALEPCRTFEYHRSQDPKQRGLRLRNGKCLQLYKYFVHPRFGFINARIQTWFPFSIQVCLNGREWLARQLARTPDDFKRVDNCFTWLRDPKRAQRLMDKQIETDWPTELTRIARSLNPLHHEIFAPWPMDYYWSGYQTEWATDVLFKDPRALADVYPALVRHAMHHFQSPDVMRFVGRKTHGNFTGELVTSFKHRPEGVRVKHWINGNSVKIYDKAGSVLRVETTIAKTAHFKVYRPRHDAPDGRLEWRPLRKGVADLHRRAEVSQRANERYLDALSAVQEVTRCATLFDRVARPVIDGERRTRSLRIGDPDDLALLRAIARGEFATAGLRNRDLARLLDPRAPGSDEARRASARISRKLRLLRAHGLIRRVPKTHRYLPTERGQLLSAALFAARETPVSTLIAAAA